MLRIVLLSALAALGAAQQRSTNSRDAAILAEERYLSVDGQFGAAYQQEDGVQFKEEADADGTRRGSYSYVDPTGQRRTVNYVAGKNGFQPTGDHIPAVPAPVVNPSPQYNPPQQQQAYSPPSTQYGSQVEDNGEWVDDTRQEYPSSNPAPQQYSAPRQQYSPPAQQYSAPQQQYNPPPQQYSAPQQQYNPPPQQYSAPQQQQQYSPPAQQWNSAPTAAPAQQKWSAPVEPTQAPHRFFPPGKLNLNRSPDGFSFSFQKS